MTKTILVTSGAKEYVGGTLTEVTGKDISLDSVMLGLSTSEDTPPASWKSPDADSSPAPNKREVKMLVDSSTVAGTWWCWVKISDNPEIIPMVLQGPIVVV